VQMVPSAQDELTVSNPVPRSAISPAFVGASLAFACLYLGAVGAITAIIPNALFARIVEPTVWSYIFWVAPAALFGVLAASYVLPPAAVCEVQRVEHSTTLAACCLSWRWVAPSATNSSCSRLARVEPSPISSPFSHGLVDCLCYSSAMHCGLGSDSAPQPRGGARVARTIRRSGRRCGTWVEHRLAKLPRDIVAHCGGNIQRALGRSCPAAASTLFRVLSSRISLLPKPL
jgi:hypothetical protein